MCIYLIWRCNPFLFSLRTFHSTQVVVAIQIRFYAPDISGYNKSCPELTGREGYSYCCKIHNVISKPSRWDRTKTAGRLFIQEPSTPWKCWKTHPFQWSRERVGIIYGYNVYQVKKKRSTSNLRPIIHVSSKGWSRQRLKRQKESFPPHGFTDVMPVI